MNNKRHHEVSPGGDQETHREHYDKTDRQIDRRERREARKEAREEFRKDRDEIRGEIDLVNAGLSRKLKVRLAEVEELVDQLKAENLGFELPSDYEDIKKNVEMLGDGDDDGQYEDDGLERKDRRRNMRNDLQTLQMTARGLRTSLRRHVNHLQDETPDSGSDDQEKPVPESKIPPVETKPEPSASGDRIPVNDHDETPEDEGEDDGKTKPVPEDPKPSQTPEVTVTTPTESVEIVTPSVEGTVDSKQKGETHLEAKLDGEEPHLEVYTGLIWTNPDIIVAPGVDPIKILEEKYQVSGDDLERFKDEKFWVWFGKNFEEDERQEIMNSLAEGKKKPFQEAYRKYKEEKEGEQRAEVQRNNTVLEESIKEANQLKDFGLEANPTDRGLEVSIEDTEEKITIISSEGDSWKILMPEHFNSLIKDGVELNFKSKEEAIDAAPRLLHAIKFIESNGTTRLPEEEYKDSPYTVRPDGEGIEFHANKWFNHEIDWEDRNIEFKPDQFVDIHSTARALNDAYFRKYPQDKSETLNARVALQKAIADNPMLKLYIETELTYSSETRSFTASLVNDEWIIDLPYQNLVSDKSKLHIPNTAKGAYELTIAMSTYASWMDHVDKMVEIISTGTEINKETSIKINEKGWLQVGELQFNTGYGSGPRFKEYVNFNDYAVTLVEHLQLQKKTLSPEEMNSTEEEINRVRHLFDGVEGVEVIETDEPNVLKAKFGEREVSIVYNTNSNQWEVITPKDIDFSLLTAGAPIDLQASSLSELSDDFKDVILLTQAWDQALAKVEEYKLEEDDIVEKGGPIYIGNETFLSDQKIRISEGGYLWDTAMDFTELINQTSHSDLNTFVHHFNQVYLSKNPDLMKKVMDAKKGSNEDTANVKPNTGVQNHPANPVKPNALADQYDKSKPAYPFDPRSFDSEPD